MRLFPFNITIERHIPIDKMTIYTIQLGKWWSINLSRKFIEDYIPSDREGRFKFTKHPLSIHLKEGEIIPYWYGFAYRDFYTDTTVFMPIPLNYIRAAWDWFKFHILIKIKFDWARMIVHHWILRIHRDGYDKGYDDGYHQFKWECEQDAKKLVDRIMNDK